MQFSYSCLLPLASCNGFKSLKSFISKLLMCDFLDRFLKFSHNCNNNFNSLNFESLENCYYCRNSLTGLMMTHISDFFSCDIISDFLKFSQKWTFLSNFGLREFILLKKQVIFSIAYLSWMLQNIMKKIDRQNVIWLYTITVSWLGVYCKQWKFDVTFQIQVTSNCYGIIMVLYRWLRSWWPVWSLDLWIVSSLVVHDL